MRMAGRSPARRYAARRLLEKYAKAFKEQHNPTAVGEAEAERQYGASRETAKVEK